MAVEICGLASKLNYSDLFAKDPIADTLCKDLELVAFRRVVISQPRDNMTEAFKFSSRHSEFVKLKAEALISEGSEEHQSATQTTDSVIQDDHRRYKVVLVYPDRTSSHSMLVLKNQGQDER